jgi:hypothetical protein
VSKFGIGKLGKGKKLTLWVGLKMRVKRREGNCELDEFV